MNKSSPKRLFRSTNDRIIGGVCAGFADYFHLDPTIMRLIYIALTLITGGICIIIYLLFWFLMPTKSEAQRTEQVGNHQDPQE